MRRAWIRFDWLIATLLFAHPARAGEGQDEARLSPWDQGNARPFVAARIDVGPTYGKTLVALGYGKPHWMWAGVEAFPILTSDFEALYAGARASLPFFDVAFGWRQNRSFTHGPLTPSTHYSSSDVDASSGARSRYLAWELEVSGLAPVLHGFAVFAVNVDKVLDAPPGTFLYEESTRVVISPPWVISTRLGWVYSFGESGTLKAGAVGELVVVPGRPSNVVRVGPAFVYTLTEHLELLGFLAVAVKSPDDLGLVLGAFGTGGLRYKWATGEQRPAFP